MQTIYILHHRRWMSMFANLHSGNPVHWQSFAIIYMPLSRVNIPLYSFWCSGPSQIPLAAAAFHVPLPSVPSAAFSLESRRNQSPPQSPQCLMKVSRSPWQLCRFAPFKLIVFAVTRTHSAFLSSWPAHQHHIGVGAPRKVPAAPAYSLACIFMHAQSIQ